IILARLLLPEQFGLIAMLTIFMAIAQSLLDSGFGSALIQKEVMTEEDTSSVFFFNILISLVLTGILCLLAPWIADFYQQPDLLFITWVMSLVIVINSFSVVQTAILTRDMNLKIQAKVGLMAWLGSGGIGISLAYCGFGVWSLVAQQVTAALFRAMFFWMFNHWRPKFIFSFQALRQMYSFGSRMFATGLLNQVFENLNYVVIGKIFNPMTMGFYYRACLLAEMPASTLSAIVYRVSFPVFSSMQGDDIRLKKVFHKAFGILVFINAPIMIGLAVIAKPLVLCLLTEKWLPSVPYLQLLCILGLLLPIHTLNQNILTAKGRSDLFFRLEIIKKVMLLLNIVILWYWGIILFICGQIVVSFITFFLNSYYASKLMGYNTFAQMGDVGLYLFFALLMGGGVHVVGYLTFSSNTLMLLSQIISGLTIYLFLAIIFRPPAYLEGLEAAQHQLSFFQRLWKTRKK
ncbi:lipopolysaccharide biosynthesis protein, partial [Candidatus Roizmanbacteria bacterium]|nr:lipopolysaccharide biosynthesis protein [Candidatus Roizmanbacteria bacterium]